MPNFVTYSHPDIIHMGLYPFPDYRIMKWRNIGYIHINELCMPRPPDVCRKTFVFFNI